MCVLKSARSLPRTQGSPGKGSQTTVRRLLDKEMIRNKRITWSIKWLEVNGVWCITVQKEDTRHKLRVKFRIFKLTMEVQFSSVAQSCLTLCDPVDCSTPPCPSTTPGIYSNSCPLSQWCHPTIWFSKLSPSPPAFNFYQHQGLFQWVSSSHYMAKVLTVSASPSILPMNIQDWFPLGWTDWISLLSQGRSRVFFNTTVQKHPFFSTQLSL